MITKTERIYNLLNAAPLYLTFMIVIIIPVTCCIFPPFLGEGGMTLSKFVYHTKTFHT